MKKVMFESKILSVVLFIVRLKFQKQSVLKFVSRTIPHSGGYNTRSELAELFPKLALGFIPVILFFLCVIPNLSYATSPKSVDLTYDMNAQTLSVTVDHHTASANLHHIEYVEIKKNGAPISKNEYKNQPTDSIFTYTYKIPAVKGDIFEVTATCNVWGHKTATLTVP